MDRSPLNLFYIFIYGAFIFIPGHALGENTISLSEAIRQTFTLNQNVQIEKARVIQSRGRYRSTAGQFDWGLSSRIERESSRGPNPQANDIQTVERELYVLGISKQLRNGISLTPSVSIQEANDILPDSPVSISSVNMQLNIPLLRNRGAQHTGAEERAAYADYQGSTALQTQQIADRISNTAIAFYICLAASERLQILKDAEQLTQSAMNTVNQMITAAMLDPADVYQAQAVVASKAALRREGEQTLLRSRLALAAAIGYSAEKIMDAPLAEGTFPDPIDASILDTISKMDMIRRALAERGDYLASQKSIEAASALHRKAGNARRMRLDFNFGIGYTGFNLSSDVSRRIRALYTNPIGPNIIAGVSMQLPVRNDGALGNLAFREAVLEEAQQQADRVSTLISTEVLAAMEDLHSTIDQIQFVFQGEDIFQQALEHENKKLTTGQSSLSDLLQLQDRYIDIRLAKVQALREYAVAMIRFRLVTGTLLEHGNITPPFDIQKLSSLPFISQ